MAQPASLDSNFAVPDEPTSDNGYAFIGAVHALVNSKASATKPDLILAAVSQAIRDGDKTTGEVLTVVNNIWPGAKTDFESVETALELGVELGLISERVALDETHLWSLTVFRPVKMRTSGVSIGWLGIDLCHAA